MSTAKIPGASSYRLSEFDDPRAELERLQAQAAIVFAQEDAALRDLGFPQGGRVLEAGCGPGFFARGLKRMRPELSVVGLDVDQAGLRLSGEHMPALRGDARALPFPARSFDAAYARLLFRHLAAPERVACELARVVRPGGRVFAIDSDDGQLLLDPVPDGFLRVQEARHTSIRRRGCDPHTARRIAGMFAQAGLQDIQVRGIAISSTVLGRRVFARTVLFPVTQAIDPDLLSPDMIQRCQSTLEAWCCDERAFGMTVATVVGGVVA